MIYTQRNWAQMGATLGDVTDQYDERQKQQAAMLLDLMAMGTATSMSRGDGVNPYIKPGGLVGRWRSAGTAGSKTTMDSTQGRVPVPGDSDFIGPLPTANYGRLEIIKGGIYSQSEVNAARYMAGEGYNVVLRPPVGTRAGGGTSDLLVNGVNYDVYTPVTGNPSAIIRAISKKNTQTVGVVLDLSKTSVVVEDLGNILARVKGAIEKNGGTCNITDIIVIP